MSSVHGLRLFQKIQSCVLRHGVASSAALRRGVSSGFVRSQRGQHPTPSRWLSGTAAEAQSVALRLNCQVGFIPHPEKAHKGGEVQPCPTPAANPDPGRSLKLRF